MRIATNTFYNNALYGIEQERTQLSALNQELATGKKVNTPSDNPSAFANGERLQADMSALGQYTSDDARLSDQLGLASKTLDAALTTLSSVKSLALQAANGTSNAANRAALVKQVESAKAQLLSLANTRSGSGQYLYSGSKGLSAPFYEQPGGQVIYRGDGASGTISSAPDASVTALLSGMVFAAIPQGNAYGTVSAASSNTGSALAVMPGITSPAAATTFRNGTSPYSVSFASVAGSLQYTIQQGGTTVGTGTFTSGTTLTMGGISVRFDGTPAAGDQFTLSPSRPQSLFDTVDQLAGALAQPVSTAAERAQNTQQIDTVLNNLSQAHTSLLAQQSTIGVSMNALKETQTANAMQQNNDTRTLSTEVDANIPKVMTTLNERQTALTAAMKAFSAVASLSLFKYL